MHFPFFRPRPVPAPVYQYISNFYSPNITYTGTPWDNNAALPASTPWPTAVPSACNPAAFSGNAFNALGLEDQRLGGHPFVAMNNATPASLQAPLPDLNAQLAPYFGNCAVPRKTHGRRSRKSTPPKSPKFLPEDQSPTVERPLHKHLMDIDWDITQPLSNALCWTRSMGVQMLDSGAPATLPTIVDIEMNYSNDSYITRSVSALNHLFYRIWMPPVATSRNGSPLTNQHVLTVLQAYFYELLTGPEIAWLSSEGLYQTLWDSNMRRVREGQWLSSGDIGRFRRVDLLNGCTKFKGFKYGAVDGDRLAVSFSFA